MRRHRDVGVSITIPMYFDGNLAATEVWCVNPSWLRSLSIYGSYCPTATLCYPNGLIKLDGPWTPTVQYRPPFQYVSVRPDLHSTELKVKLISRETHFCLLYGNRSGRPSRDPYINKSLANFPTWLPRGGRGGAGLHLRAKILKITSIACILWARRQCSLAPVDTVINVMETRSETHKLH